MLPAGDLPGKASGQITLPDKRITIWQAPSDGSLLCFITIPSPLAKVMNGNQVERGTSMFGNAIANGDNDKTITDGGAGW